MFIIIIVIKTFFALFCFLSAGVIIDVTRSYTNGFIATAGFLSFSFLLPFLLYCFKPWRIIQDKENPPCHTELVVHLEDGALTIDDKEPLKDIPEDFAVKEFPENEKVNRNGDDTTEENLKLLSENTTHTN